MKLMTKELEAQLPRLYATDGLGVDATAHAHFMAPYSDMDWYMTEYDPEDRLGYGAVVTPTTREQCADGFEWGYFSLDEMETLNADQRSPLAFVERDTHFEPASIGELVEENLRDHEIGLDRDER